MLACPIISTWCVDPSLRRAAEVSADAEERRKRERADFMEAAKTQLLSGERQIFEFFLCKVGKTHSDLSSLKAC